LKSHHIHQKILYYITIWWAKKYYKNYSLYKFERSSNDDYDASSWSEKLTTPTPLLQQHSKSFMNNREQLILSNCITEEHINSTFSKSINKRNK